MPNQNATNEQIAISAEDSKKNISDKSHNYSDVNDEPVTHKNETVSKIVDFLEISSETNVNHKSGDGSCIKELEATSESKSSENDTRKEIVGPNTNATNNDKEKSDHGLEYFVSMQEDADNNNPEWELLRKIKTDEERYKAVRMRWKNLVIPNPNQILTFRSGGFRKPTSEIGYNIKNRNASKSRKRTLSDAAEIGISNEPKRARTVSCTALFDRKVQQLHNSMNQAIRRIENNAKQAVNDLNCRETSCFMYRPPGSRAEEVYRKAVHIQNIVDLRRQYEMQAIVAMKEGEGEINALQKAMEEVRVFNSFYQGLEPGLENTIFLSASDLEELVEEDKLYDKFQRMYK